jgi:outer membrane protein assembly factor BamB
MGVVLAIGALVFAEPAAESPELMGPPVPEVEAAPASETVPGATDHVGADTIGKPWGKVTGTLQFRGNPTRTWYGEGPVPSRPVVQWRFPKTKNGEGMCADSPIGKRPRHWCGTGWTGQPVVWERPDGVREVIFGAFDMRVHFLDARTGKRTRPDFRARDIIKGSVTLDPDGYPLIYFGARDGKYRIVAIDRKRPKELWALRARDFKGPDNDFDSSGTIVDGILYVGGENGYVFAMELQRSFDGSGRVQVDPKILAAIPSGTPEFIEMAHSRKTSVESSVTIFENRLYATNGLGRVFGVDISNIRAGEAPVVFEFWTGEDTDATVVVDEQGKLYVASELERDNERSREIGHIMKLDPEKEDPLVWSHHIPGIPGDPRGGGIWSTAALGDGVIYATTQSGRLMVLDRDTGEIVWEKLYKRHLWASPVLVDQKLIIATCKSGELVAYDVSNPRAPKQDWSLKLGAGGCIESTPALWRGQIFVGSWEGYLFAVGDPASAAEHQGPEGDERDADEVSAAPRAGQ